MSESIAPYASAMLALGVFGLLYLAQLLVADLVAIRRKHTPGIPVSGGHEDPLFRATRAHANTTESVGAVILIAAFAIARGGSPGWVNGALWSFVVFRLAHMLAYYFDLRAVRGVAFALAIAALLTLFIVGAQAL